MTALHKVEGSQQKTALIEWWCRSQASASGEPAITNRPKHRYGHKHRKTYA